MKANRAVSSRSSGKAPPTDTTNPSAGFHSAHYRTTSTVLLLSVLDHQPERHIAKRFVQHHTRSERCKHHVFERAAAARSRNSQRQPQGQLTERFPTRPTGQIYASSKPGGNEFDDLIARKGPNGNRQSECLPLIPVMRASESESGTLPARAYTFPASFRRRWPFFFCANSAGVKAQPRNDARRPSVAAWSAALPVDTLTPKALQPPPPRTSHVFSFTWPSPAGQSDEAIAHARRYAGGSSGATDNTASL